MLPIFTKPLEALTTSDLDELVRERYPEGSTVEYKEALPCKKGKTDPWLSDAAEISEFARNKLLEEVVAFANTHGGHLLIGIKETEEKPRGAMSICPLPHAADLAERIRLQARDCIEPKLPLLHTTAIKTDGSGRGVVVVRVPASRAAPHRLMPDWHCYIRRADRTEKMTMREIQDLTLHVERGLAAIDSAFTQRARLFERRTNALCPNGNQVCGIRATAIPLAEIHLGEVYRHERGFAALRTQNVNINGTAHQLVLPNPPDRERPQLRGTRQFYEYDNRYHDLEVFRNGVIEESYCVVRDVSEDGAANVYLGWTALLVLSVLSNITRFRQYAGAPYAEYGLEVEIFGAPSRAQLISLKSSDGFVADMGDLPLSRFRFPRYSIGPEPEFPVVLSEFVQDCTDAVGFRR